MTKITIKTTPGLLPCPFCGGAAEQITDVIMGTFIGCSQCPCQLPQGEGKEERIAAWNSRVCLANGKLTTEQRTPAGAEKYPEYFIYVGDVTHIDIYEIHHRYNVNDPSGIVQHSSKKLLLSGKRTGGKPALTDIKEARDTLNRKLEMESTNQSGGTA